jgi:hypothetical protein
MPASLLVKVTGIKKYFFVYAISTMAHLEVEAPVEASGALEEVDVLAEEETAEEVTSSEEASTTSDVFSVETEEAWVEEARIVPVQEAKAAITAIENSNAPRNFFIF